MEAASLVHCPKVNKASCAEWWAVTGKQESWLTKEQILALLLGQVASLLITSMLSVWILPDYWQPPG
jgi:hypothetical protein